ncbi:MAG TPA: hypothetical protein VIG30_14490 [Ktedonobacterales bacterium]
MPANRAGRRRQAPRGSRVLVFAAAALTGGALALGLFAGVTPVWARPALGAASEGQAATSALGDLTSNGLLIFTTIGCIFGVIGLLAVIVASVTLVSDGWGPMLKAMIRGNRRGRLRFKRRGGAASGDARRAPRSDPRGGGTSDYRQDRGRGDARARPRPAATTARTRDGWR